jgi:putative ABC transport system substrate-binding protein
VAGGLLGYGTSLAAAYLQNGRHIGRFLHGEKPADLPVIQPRVFELIVNLKTAKTLGSALPTSLLGEAGVSFGFAAVHFKFRGLNSETALQTGIQH